MIREQVDTIIAEVSRLPGVTTSPHRFGGVEFNVGKVEIGHIHRHGMVDIPFTRKIREQLVAEGEAEPHHLLADSGWISFYLRHPGDAEQAVRLYQLSYLQKTRRRGYQADEPFEDALARLAFSTAVSALLGSQAE